MDNKPDLKLVSYSNVFLYKVEKGRNGKNVLKFFIMNVGEGTAKYDHIKKTWVQLTYGTYATHRDYITKELKKDDWCPVEFPLPDDKYYDPDCEFEIAIDIEKNLDESNRDNNFSSGVIKKGTLPDEEPSDNTMEAQNVENILVNVLTAGDPLSVKLVPMVKFKLGEEDIPGRILQNEDASGYEVPPKFIGKPYTIEITIVPTNPGEPKPDLKSSALNKGAVDVGRS